MLGAKFLLSLRLNATNKIHYLEVGASAWWIPPIIEPGHLGRPSAKPRDWIRVDPSTSATPRYWGSTWIPKWPGRLLIRYHIQKGSQLSVVVWSLHSQTKLLCSFNKTKHLRYCGRLLFSEPRYPLNALAWKNGTTTDCTARTKFTDVGVADDIYSYLFIDPPKC